MVGKQFGSSFMKKFASGKTVVMAFPKGQKPTRFRFKGNIRLGFRRNKVVEIVKFTRRSK